MTAAIDPTGSHHDPLDAVIAEYLQQVEAGHVPDRDFLRARHPELADRLGDFFADYDRLGRQAAELRLSGDPNRTTDGAEPGSALPRVRYFGDYELLEEIAHGSMGVVYRARQMSLNRIVALKMILRDRLATPRDVARFRAEAEAAANLDHPNIVPIYEVGEHEGRQYYAMRLIEGPSLANQPCGDPRTEAHLLATVARAVHFAHQRGILHRDLKPSNILLGPGSGEPVPFVTDFGLAKRLDSTSDLTASGEMVGTPRYMAPEQAAGRKDLSVAADVYSLGVVLYQRLTGAPPFESDNILDLLHQVRETEPPRPSSRRMGLDRDLETICLKCLEKEPARRYVSAEALADDLERWLRGEPILARPGGDWDRLVKWVRRRPAEAALVAVSATAVLLLLAVSGWYNVKLKQRLWQSLFDQARAERLAGDHNRSLEVIREAAQQKQTPELRQEAIQTLTSPRVRLVHSVPVGQVLDHAFSPDGKLLAVLGGNQIQLLEMPSGKLQRQFPVEQMVHCRIGFGPDGPLAVNRENDGSWRWWDLTTGQERGRTTGPVACSFSPDGRYLVVSDNRTTWVWNVALGKEEPLRAPGTRAAFSSTGELLVQDGNRIRLWQVATGRELGSTPQGQVPLAISASARVAALLGTPPGGFGRAITIWDIKAGKALRVLPLGTDGAGDRLSHVQAHLNVDGSLLAFRDPDDPTYVKIWDTTTGRFRRGLAGWGVAGGDIFTGLEGDRLASALFSPNGSWLAASAGYDTVRLWDVETGREVAALKGNKMPLWCPDGRLLATRGAGQAQVTVGGITTWISAGLDTVINVWEVTRSTPTYVLSAAIESLSLRSDGKELAVNGTLWEVGLDLDRPRLQRLARPMPGGQALFDGRDQLWAIAFQQGPPDSPERVLRLRPLNPPGPELSLPNPGFRRRHPFAFSPDGKLLVRAREKEGQGNDLELWDLREGKRLAEWVQEREQFQALTFNADGRRVATASNFEAKVLDAATGRMLQRFSTPGPIFCSHLCLAFSPDSRLLYSGTMEGISQTRDPAHRTVKENGKVYVGNVETGQVLGAWEGHEGSVLSLAVRPDGGLVASGGSDQTIRLWEAPKGRELARWEAHGGGVTALAFSPDGTTLISGGSDGTVRLWDLAWLHRELAAYGLGW